MFALPRALRESSRCAYMWCCRESRQMYYRRLRIRAYNFNAYNSSAVYQPHGTRLNDRGRYLGSPGVDSDASLIDKKLVIKSARDPSPSYSIFPSREPRRRVGRRAPIHRRLGSPIAHARFAFFDIRGSVFFFLRRHDDARTDRSHSFRPRLTLVSPSP